MIVQKGPGGCGTTRSVCGSSLIDKRIAPGMVRQATRAVVDKSAIKGVIGIVPHGTVISDRVFRDVVPVSTLAEATFMAALGETPIVVAVTECDIMDEIALVLCSLYGDTLAIYCMARGEDETREWTVHCSRYSPSCVGRLVVLRTLTRFFGVRTTYGDTSM